MAQKITPFLWFANQAEGTKKPARVTEAFLKMKKFDIAELEQVYEGR